MKTTQNTFRNQPKTRFSALPVFLIIMAIIFLPRLGNSQVSTDNSHDVVYKFTVVGITSPADAAHVMSALLEQEFSSSCNFIDEADCFKLSANTTLNYATIQKALQSRGYILSDKTVVSDGSVLKTESEINETLNHEN